MIYPDYEDTLPTGPTPLEGRVSRVEEPRWTIRLVWAGVLVALCACAVIFYSR